MQRIKKLSLIFLVLLAVAAMAGTSRAASPAKGLYQGQPARYVFFIIGDGMAQPQRTATEMYLAAKDGKPHGSVKLAMSELSAQGIMTTYAANSIIPDSADTATALACGVKTNSGMLGVTPDGRPYKNVSELAKARGMKVGIISTVSLDHATPAGFYAHQKSRNYYHEISYEMVMSGFDFFGGGGIKDPEGKKALDNKPKGNIMDLAKHQGYKVVKGKSDVTKLTPEDGKVIAINEWLQDSDAMPYTMDRTEKDMSLADLVAKAAEMLDNPKGFFIMAEGGKVDWACHANDAMASITDTIDTDNAVKAALKFAEKHPGETLILVVGDHETGGMTIGFAGTQYDSYYKVLDGQKMSYQQFSDEIVADYKKSKSSDYKFEDLKPAIEKYFGLKFEGDPKDQAVLKPHETAQIQEAFNRSMSGDKENSKDPLAYNLYGGYEPLTVKLTQLLNQKAGLGWTTYSHTGLPVTVSAEGVGAESFTGYYDNTDVAAKLKAVMGLPTVPEIAAQK